MNFNTLKQYDLSMLYITSKNCNVCKSIYPKLNAMISKYKSCHFTRIETDEFPEVSGEFMTFTVPTVILYSQGRELFRAARFIDILTLESEVKKYYDIIFKEGTT